ncbi:cytochrome o ubiquinol oxidase subunit 2 [Novosphingobium chloroacetimidivorans]|uniref:Ubiquinol oxidase polypeptide II n=1 Tax=Novosphingobium chloroacetimidivorans TaxID=1428314 RepID=A0A7W7K808_9SPHN|nr:ubiquinol oxidase subunit II [Novosphingobium chloroacetimidivorans]MBB4857566.1 cytochrome o ubiquinol oxidase subunit 2 [Novosphingobium chloroacetimidivorans]
MREDKLISRLRHLAGRALAMAPLLLLGACQSELLDPAGDIALQQRDIIYISTALMLLIIVPVMALTVIFAWHYRAKNAQATYDPDFDHSTSLELVIWAAPLLIIICLGALTWWSTHLLDPFRPLNRISASKPIDPKAKPLVVQVVSLDWKWLFIYPEQGVASVNQLALPVDRPVRFELTSTNMMNTFYAPTLAGMIYTMPGMRSTLHAVLNKPGHYRGMSGNYSGAGFSYMNFTLDGVDQRGFDAWVARAKGSGAPLDTARFLELEKPSEKVPPMLFSGVAPGLFDRVYNRCVKPGTPCMSEMMHHGQGGPGSGMPSTRNAPPPSGGKPEGAIFKEGEEKGTAPNVTKPRNPNDATGSTAPHSHKNESMSFNLVPAAPGLLRSGVSREAAA